MSFLQSLDRNRDAALLSCINMRVQFVQNGTKGQDRQIQVALLSCSENIPHKIFILLSALKFKL